MAKKTTRKLDQVVADNARKRRSFNQIYPWGDWFKRDTFVLMRGRDYHCLPAGMRSNVLQAAKRFGVRVSISQDVTTITVTVVERL